MKPERVQARRGKRTDGNDKQGGGKHGRTGFDTTPRKQQRQKHADGKRDRQRHDAANCHVVQDGVGERAARGSKNRPRERRRKHTRDRDVERHIPDEQAVQHPRDSRPLQAGISNEKEERDEDVLPQVRNGGPDRERHVAPEQRDRPRDKEHRQQACGPQRVTRFRRFNRSHDTRTPPPRLLHSQSWISTAGAGGFP